MATIFYASIVSDANTISKDTNSGTASTAGDIIELRMGNGTYVPTQREVLNGMEIIERWIRQNGLNGAGANLPPVR